ICAGRLALARRTDVRTTPRHPAKRALMEFVRADRPAAVPEVSELVIGTGEHECYTPEYRALTRDFYLKF
ncbi:MAG: methyltransferase, partial [Alistipes shahii]|nr:methyltransferase [Alistipes shahii]